MQISFRNYFYGAALMACVPLGFAGVPGSSIDQEAMQQLQDKIKTQQVECMESTDAQQRNDAVLRHRSEFANLLDDLKLEPDLTAGEEELDDAIIAETFTDDSALEDEIKKQVTPDMARYFYTGQWIHKSAKEPELLLEDALSISELTIFSKASAEIAKAVEKLEKDIKALYSGDTVSKSRKGKKGKKGKKGREDKVVTSLSPSENVARHQFSTLSKLPGLRPVDILKFTHLIDANQELIPVIYERVDSTDTFDKIHGNYDTLLQLLHASGAEPAQISSLTSGQQYGMFSLFALSRQGNSNDFFQDKENFALRHNTENEKNKNELDRLTLINNTLAGEGEKESVVYLTVNKENRNEFFMLGANGSQLTIGVYVNEGLLLAYRIPEEKNASFLASLMGYMSPEYTAHDSQDEVDGSISFTFKNGMDYTFRAEMPEQNGAAVNDKDNYPAKRTSCSCNCLGHICSGCKQICSLTARALTYPFSAREPRVEVDDRQ